MPASPRRSSCPPSASFSPPAPCAGCWFQHQSVRLSVEPNHEYRSFPRGRSEEHTSELQSLMRISYAVFCLKKKNNNNYIKHNIIYRTHYNANAQQPNIVTD